MPRKATVAPSGHVSSDLRRRYQAALDSNRTLQADVAERIEQLKAELLRIRRVANAALAVTDDTDLSDMVFNPRKRNGDVYTIADPFTVTISRSGIRAKEDPRKRAKRARRIRDADVEDEALPEEDLETSLTAEGVIARASQRFSTRSSGSIAVLRKAKPTRKRPRADDDASDDEGDDVSEVQPECLPNAMAQLILRQLAAKTTFAPPVHPEAEMLRQAEAEFPIPNARVEWSTKQDHLLTRCVHSILPSETSLIREVEQRQGELSQAKLELQVDAIKAMMDDATNEEGKSYDPWRHIATVLNSVLSKWQRGDANSDEEDDENAEEHPRCLSQLVASCATRNKTEAFSAFACYLRWYGVLKPCALSGGKISAKALHSTTGFTLAMDKAINTGLSLLDEGAVPGRDLWLRLTSVIQAKSAIAICGRYQQHFNPLHMGQGEQKGQVTLLRRPKNRSDASEWMTAEDKYLMYLSNTFGDQHALIYFKFNDSRHIYPKKSWLNLRRRCETLKAFLQSGTRLSERTLSNPKFVTMLSIGVYLLGSQWEGMARLLFSDTAFAEHLQKQWSYLPASRRAVAKGKEEKRQIKDSPEREEPVNQEADGSTQQNLSSSVAKERKSAGALRRVHWDESELNELRRRTRALGSQNWAAVAAGFPHRSPEECRALWQQSLSQEQESAPPAAAGAAVAGDAASDGPGAAISVPSGTASQHATTVRGASNTSRRFLDDDDPVSEEEEYPGTSSVAMKPVPNPNRPSSSEQQQERENLSDVSSIDRENDDDDDDDDDATVGETQSSLLDFF